MQVFSANGKFLREWGSRGDGDGQFTAPFGIAISTSGEVYIADSFNDRVQAFNPDGEVLWNWGSLGSGIRPTIL